MEPVLTYRQGYLDGYRGRSGEEIGNSHNQAARESGQLNGLDESDYWIGFYHGRYHCLHSEPAGGAVERGEIPDIL